MLLILSLLLASLYNHLAQAAIDRELIVRSFNVKRNVSSNVTPLQVGNGNFAFGADVTGLQTFKPFGTMSSWGWHNASLPTTPGQTKLDGKPQTRSWLPQRNMKV
jgi:hypothetical protein